MILIRNSPGENDIATHYQSHKAKALHCRVMACNDCRLGIIRWSQQSQPASKYERLCYVNWIWVNSRVWWYNTT